jgi:hypothetical protein
VRERHGPQVDDAPWAYANNLPRRKEMNLFSSVTQFPKAVNPRFGLGAQANIRSTM